jgi:hypothetical protein
VTATRSSPDAYASANGWSRHHRVHFSNLRLGIADLLDEIFHDPTLDLMPRIKIGDAEKLAVRTLRLSVSLSGTLVGLTQE